MGSVVISTNIDIVLLIAITAVLFIGAFLVSPFFFGKCFVAKKFTRVQASDANELLSNAKSLSKIEVVGDKVILTRAGDIKRARFEISAKGTGKFNMNKKVLVIFGNEETSELVFDSEVQSLYLVELDEKGKNSIFLSNFLSALIIASIQFVVVSGVIALFVYSYSGFNEGFKGVYLLSSPLWYEDYNFAYLACLFGLIVGVVSFIINFDRMKLSQKPLKLFSKKGGNK